MFTYSSLENIPMNILHKSFVKAFSDYEVNFDIPLSKFEDMLIRRGYDSKISIGAFKDNILVGFIFNGLRVWNNKKTAYDTGTGVIKEYRNQGITTAMFNNLRKKLMKNNVTQYLLEVIKTNTVAFELYKKQGFKVIRSFDCYKLDKLSYTAKNTYLIDNKPILSDDEWNELSKFNDIKPSWQNSIESIKSTPTNFIFSLVKDTDKIIGYGVVNKITGDIPQIAVHPHYRKMGIGKNIIYDLYKNTQSNTLSLLNVDSNYEPLIKMLLSIGFTNYVGQYEMLLEL
ncbi:GNAT family N-acetyltransferase [Clostridium sp. AL.422]|uniref:GNAT family N-acetyltransferase n=1 Tax=Clostridium TaxID=1485 RepID=UPI00293DE9DD|nr:MULTISPECIES: GNAT family N-acetyltransferase [unclassified Clostridium]MDV4150999.1 GNAT family N-acetyltransferase [Clostridium sp. AL.422]